MTPIAPIAGNAIDRSLWNLDYLARTVFYNGYWQDFRPTKDEKGTLKAAGRFGTRTELKRLLAAGVSPIDHALDQMAEMGAGHLEGERREAALGQWQVVEAVLNARLRLAFALARPAALGRAFEKLLPSAAPFGPLELARISPELDRKGRYGIPDSLLLGDRVALLIEMKARGLTDARKYGPRQLLQYMCLGADHLGPPGRRQRAVHLLLSPRYGGRPCWKPSVWWPEPSSGDGRLVFSRSTLRSLGRDQRWSSEFSLKAGLDALDRVPVFDRTYADLAAHLPRSSWPAGGAGDVGFAELRQVVQLAEPARHRPPLEDA